MRLCKGSGPSIASYNFTQPHIPAISFISAGRLTYMSPVYINLRSPNAKEAANLCAVAINLMQEVLSIMPVNEEILRKALLDKVSSSDPKVPRGRCHPGTVVHSAFMVH
jgi:hypothetical protein